MSLMNPQGVGWGSKVCPSKVAVAGKVGGSLKKDNKKLPGILTPDEDSICVYLSLSIYIYMYI